MYSPLGKLLRRSSRLIVEALGDGFDCIASKQAEFEPTQFEFRVCRFHLLFDRTADCNTR
jgi:hypothetical protein